MTAHQCYGYAIGSRRKDEIGPTSKTKKDCHAASPQDPWVCVSGKGAKKDNTYTNWGPSQPSCWNSEPENCADIWKVDAVPEWNDYPCSQPRCSICWIK